MSLEKKHEVAVIEMGMSHQGDITKLCKVSPLNYAIITSIGLAHAENFEDKDLGIARAKGEILFDHPKAFFNERTERYLPFKDYDHKVIVQTEGIKETKKGIYFLSDQEWIGPCKLQIDAPHLIENLHLAIALSRCIGLSHNDILNASQDLKPEKGRLDVIEKNQITFIDDSYNASPTSMKAAISYLKKQKAQRKIALIGAMRELGDITQKEHLDLHDDLKDGIDFVFFIGSETYELHQKMPMNSKYINGIDELTSDLKTFLNQGDVVLIKGSHSTNLHTLLDKL
jgi:UDP-N-acetylmuramoyl-tripeptide--D-alanyl-D-alanine ligase